MPPSALRALLNIIADSVEAIERHYGSEGLEFPALDDVFTAESERARLDSVVQDAATLISAASYQLIATVQQPQTTIFNALIAYYLPVSLRVATETNVVEILREAGPRGLHVKEIAKKNNVDAAKLTRLMRYLATHHIFKELSPDTYTNNRLSSICDTGKSVSDLFANPLDKYDGTNGIAALIGHCTDQDYKGAGCILEHLQDPATAFEDSPVRTPMMRAFTSDTDMWTWFERPPNQPRLKRFGVAMDGMNSMHTTDSILKGFDWGSLLPGSVVVDVGGGIGVSCLALAKAHPHLRYVVQDRPPVVELGMKHCEQVLPGALESGYVKYQAHDFFEPQPVPDASVFVLKQITHNWPDSYAIRILKHLRCAALDSTKLVLIDNIIQYSCPDDTPVKGVPKLSPPSPLLANLGAANITPYNLDLAMFVHCGALERTMVHLVEITKSAGWKIVEVNSLAAIGPYLPHIIAVPA
ncbi:S-adenosyl-L-methionine-dependent methyltransferase [Leucogyrophana mollusca]|uniref:S-adenosyl-L-methionine-dependent methyltransferase n=1 Tax=Leucogyrophana mollusca TaxID=85980 RepID=A0ACB8BMW7_9AGAM|nr:S-adenosyl-L-methionine-dependent methyltransferase [Leucogyrophana mollusca]